MNIKKILGSNVARYRKTIGMTQEALSETLNISPKHLSSIESGRKFASASLIEKLSDILGVSPSALFYSSDHTSELDESSFGKIDRIIDRQISLIKTRIREEVEEYQSGKELSQKKKTPK